MRLARSIFRSCRTLSELRIPADRRWVDHPLPADEFGVELPAGGELLRASDADLQMPSGAAGGPSPLGISHVGFASPTTQASPEFAAVRFAVAQLGFVRRARFVDGHDRRRELGA